MQLVCKPWRKFIQQTPSVQRLLWKSPRYIKEGDNPNFILSQPEDWELRLPSGEKYFESLANTHRRFLGTVELLYQNDELSTSMYESELQYTRSAYEITSAPLKSEWKACLCRNECEFCIFVHPQLRFENVHPVIQFLQGLGRIFCCIDGYGPLLHVGLENDLDWFCEGVYPQGRLFEGFQIAWEVIKKTNNIVKTSQLRDNLVTQPASTCMLITISLCDDEISHIRGLEGVGIYIHNANGLRLGQFMFALYSAFYKVFGRLLTSAQGETSNSERNRFRESFLEERRRGDGYPVESWNNQRHRLKSTIARLQVGLRDLKDQMSNFV